jgi:hypothetical protein
MRIQFRILNNLLTQKYILKKVFAHVFVQQKDQDSGLSAIYGNADPDPGEPNQCGYSSVSGTIYKPKNIC